MTPLRTQKTHGDVIDCRLPTQNETNMEDKRKVRHLDLDKLMPQYVPGEGDFFLTPNSQKNDALLAPQKTVRDSGKSCSGVPPTQYSELFLESRNLVCQAMRGGASFALALKKLSHLIDLYPQATDAFAMRAIVKMKLGDVQGAIADCDTILDRYPDNTFALLHRTSFLKHDRVSPHSHTSRAKIVQGLIRAKKLVFERYATLIKYSGTPLIFPTKDEFSEVESLAQANSEDKCAQAVLTAMLFSHWLWTGEKFSRNQAVSCAVKMQKLWPNDKLALSVLWYLEGHLGEVSLTGNSVFGLNYGSRDELYRKECITAQVFFDYPIEQQDIDLITSIETTQLS